MITRSELLKSPEYWFEQAQNELFRQLVDYMSKENINQTELSERLGVSKGYISQILNGNFNYTLKKLIELSLAIDLIPSIEYKPIDQYIEQQFLCDNSIKGQTSISIYPDQTLRLVYSNNTKLSAA